MMRKDVLIQRESDGAKFKKRGGGRLGTFDLERREKKMLEKSDKWKNETVFLIWEEFVIDFDDILLGVERGIKLNHL